MFRFLLVVSLLGSHLIPCGGQSLAVLSEQISTSNLSESLQIDSTVRVTEQDKIDSIVKALKHLPETELTRLNISLEQVVFAGTEEAIYLQEAWNHRQMEIRDALKSMVQPMELMVNITRDLRNFQQHSLEYLVHALDSLESLLSDIDNARDYHSQGFWRDLVLTLSEDRPLAVRYSAAWVIGSAVKNSYDYQLWVLEDFDGQSCLDRLLSAFKHDIDNDDYNELLKKVFYTISSASRGNVDIGEALLAHPTRFLDRMLEIISSNRYSLDIVRKIWTYAADMLEERHYIRFTLPAINNLTTSQLDDMSSLTLLGDSFISKHWIEAALRVLSTSKDRIMSLTSVEKSVLKHSIIFLHEVMMQSESSLDQDSRTLIADSLSPIMSMKDNVLADEIRPIVATMIEHNKDAV